MLQKYLIVLVFFCALRGVAENTNGPGSMVGIISGTVVDVNDAIVPGATVVLQCPSPCKNESTISRDTGAFEFTNLSLGTPYEIGVSASGFEDWTSAPIVLTPQQSIYILANVQIQMSEAVASVTVYASREQIATEQVRLEEKQRVLGIIPNFYVVYDSKNAVPLSARLKFQLAMRVSIDPVTFAGIGILAGARQAGGTPNYVEGAKGYGQRFGAEAATGFSDILIGGAVLPSLLHQDPRYSYQGTSALAETYFPDSNRGPRLVFGNFAIGTGERMGQRCCAGICAAQAHPECQEAAFRSIGAHGTFPHAPRSNT